MTWFTQLFLGHGAAQSVVVLALAIVLGLAIGLIQFRGIRLGVGGVLFSGLALAHFGIKIDHQVLEFVREFGLILFVFSIGMQVGPSFVDSLRRRGLRLNMMAALIVMLGVLATVICYASFDIPLAVAVGLFSGGVTNTPSLAAASQVFMELGPTPEVAAKAVADAGLGYAVSYPFGIFGIISVMLIVRFVFRINPDQELQEMEAQAKAQETHLHNLTVRVANPNLFGQKLHTVEELDGAGLVISRVREPNATGHHAASPDTVLCKDMLLHAVGDEAGLKRLQMIVGPMADIDLRNEPGPLEIRHLLVTRNDATDKNIVQLGLTAGRGVTVTRIIRAETEFSPSATVPLHFGDKVVAVGDTIALNQAETLLGNSTKALRHPHILPIFLGIMLGTVLGSIPIAVPGLPSGVKLGLAGGPLLVAILLSRVHHFAGMTWYLPMSANLILREVGIALFLACVGINAGDRFVGALLDGSGLYWMSIAACITFFPLLIAAFVGRVFLKCNYASLCGLLAGSMTDPPALAFANQMLGSDAPASVYASVYPLTMFLRILMGQLLVLGLYAL
ncbi:MAG: putative transporter [Desulfovibrionaceae bacterium]